MSRMAWTASCASIGRRVEQWQAVFVWTSSQNNIVGTRNISSAEGKHQESIIADQSAALLLALSCTCRQGPTDHHPPAGRYNCTHDIRGVHAGLPITANPHRWICNYGVRRSLLVLRVFYHSTGRVRVPIRNASRAPVFIHFRLSMTVFVPVRNPCYQARTLLRSCFWPRRQRRRFPA